MESNKSVLQTVLENLTKKEKEQFKFQPGFESNVMRNSSKQNRQLMDEFLLDIFRISIMRKTLKLSQSDIVKHLKFIQKFESKKRFKWMYIYYSPIIFIDAPFEKLKSDYINCLRLEIIKTKNNASQFEPGEADERLRILNLYVTELTKKVIKPQRNSGTKKSYWKRISEQS